MARLIDLSDGIDGYLSRVGNTHETRMKVSEVIGEELNRIYHSCYWEDDAYGLLRMDLIDLFHSGYFDVGLSNVSVQTGNEVNIMRDEIHRALVNEILVCGDQEEMPNGRWSRHGNFIRVQTDLVEKFK